MPDTPHIIDRGRGPEIAGTRITVYDVMDYYKQGWRPDAIAFLFQVTPEQIHHAICYIEMNREQVTANYQRILERSARGNPPHVQAIADEIHSRFQERVKRLQSQGKKESQRARSSAGREH